jgi:protein O-GlcNAc transferase
MISTALDLKSKFEAGVAAHRARRLSQAETLYLEVLASDPAHEQAAYLASAIAIESGRPEAAIPRLEKLIASHPENPIYHSNLGEASRRLERYEAAAAAFVRAAAINPDLGEVHYNLGLVMQALGDEQAALQAFERAADLLPSTARVQRTLAAALRRQGALERALGHLQAAHLADPRSAEMLLELASVLRELDRPDAALAMLQRTSALQTDAAAVALERGAILQSQRKYDEALLAVRKAIELDPDRKEAYFRLGTLSLELGQLDAAIAAYRRAVMLDPGDASAHSNLLFALHFHPAYSPEALLQEARAWAARHEASAALPPAAHENDRTVERRLRVGYVSTNFYINCQTLFTAALFTRHDRTNFELFAYSGVARPDAVTARLRDSFDHWRDISTLSDEQSAELIRDDRIDILIDLTMHMAVSKLPLFALKPAPVQIAWLAYPGTTGLSRIDYRITDPHLDPPESGWPYSERRLALPETFWCYDPLAKEPAPGALPALAAGHVTFGCLNAFWKINDGVLALWARVLNAVSESRLILLAPEGSARERVTKTLAKHGIGPERVEFVPRQSRPDYLSTYRRIDVCLDTLPYNGHTTSLDSFWMGVPVLTCVGSTIVGRAGLCQAQNLGLPQLVAHTPEAFVGTAGELVSDLPALENLRQNLRARLEQSPLMNAERFARNLEAAYREAWQAWCRGS